MGVRAIDVSRWQGNIDWGRVRDDGVRGAWIKVGGADGSLYRDARAGDNLAGAPAAGIVYGTYYFCVPDSDPRRQAHHAVTLGHGRGQLPPAADVESNPNGLSQRAIDEWCTAFCAEIHHLTGRESIIYTYSGARLVGYTDAAPGHCRLWIANYGSRDTPGTIPPAFSPHIPPAWARRGWDVWQFNSTTRVPGITGNTVDQNVVTDAAWAEMTGAVAASPAPKEDYTMKIVYCPEHTSGVGWLTLPGMLRLGLTTQTKADVALKVGDADGSVELKGGEAWDYLNDHFEVTLHSLHWGAVQLMTMGVERNTEATTRIVNEALGHLEAPELPADFAGQVIAAVAPEVKDAAYQAAKAGAQAGVDAELDAAGHALHD